MSISTVWMIDFAAPGKPWDRAWVEPNGLQMSGIPTEQEKVGTWTLLLLWSAHGLAHGGEEVDSGT